MTLMSTTLRPYLADDFDVVSMIFVESIAVLTEEDYSENQRAAWISRASDEERFAKRLSGAITIIADVDGEPAGFASLKDNVTIDFLYVHPDFARQKVATILCEALERLAVGRGSKEVVVDASDTALPFFDGRGYAPQQRNSVPIEDEWLANTTMKKDVSGIVVGRA
jgi:putative acetyltransferase